MSRKNKYLDLVGKLEKRIARMKENTLMMPEQEMAEEFGVSKPTLRRALKALEEKGQICKKNGVGIVVSHPPREISQELIFVCNDIVFFAESLKSFGIFASAANYFISIVPLTGDVHGQERTIASVAERRPAGVVVYADPRQNQLSAFHQLAASGIPTVYLVRLPHGIDNNLLELANSDGVSEIVEIFYREGCRRIALYSDEAVNPVAAAEREEGFYKGMKRCRLKPRQGFLCPYDATADKRKAFLQLFSNRDKRPDAVCSLNDHCAGGLIKTLLERGIDIKDIRFSGFDNAPLSEFIPHRILTVQPPMEELGKVAGEMLIRQLENPQFGFQRRKLQSSILSTGLG